LISAIISILEFILALGLLLFFHEFGHFIASRLLKIEVEEFGFGFPPRAISLFKLGGTLFTLNWIPFGAFVKPKGENDPECPGGLAAASPWTRLAVLFAGPLMNILVGIVLYSFIFMQVGRPNPEIVQVLDVAPKSPAYEAGLRPGDIIKKINEKEINSTQSLSEEIQANLGEKTEITYSRENKIGKLTLIPRINPPEGEGAIGIVMGNQYEPISWFEAIPNALSFTYLQTVQFIEMPIRLIQGTVPAEQARVVGPVGIYQFYDQARQMDAEATTSPLNLPAVNALGFLAIISVALGLTNLLPFPALDGGRILMTLPEIILRKRIPTRYENMLNLIGFAALILLMTVVTFQDVSNLVISTPTPTVIPLP
jgi:regulator of sigma E protease